MKTTTFLRTLLAITTLSAALTSMSCTDDNEKDKKKVSPKAIDISYKITTKEKDPKLVKLAVSNTKGIDSAITKGLKMPMEVKVRRATPSKNSVIKMKAEFEKPGKYQFEILINNKSAKKNEITVTDVKKESVLEHKF